MNILSLNCQKAYNKNLSHFLSDILKRSRYDFLILQEVTEEVLDYLRHPSYQVLTAWHEKTNQPSHLCIIYKKSFKLKEPGLISIDKFNRAAHLESSPSFGLLCGTFQRENIEIAIGSMHLHSGFSAQARRDDLQYIKNTLSKKYPNTEIIIGGDCNFGPFEKKKGFEIMAPDFMCPTKAIKKTLDSRYSEFHPNILNRIAFIFGKIGLGISLSTDHFFINRQAGKKLYKARLIPEQVSDHKPIELILK